MSKTKPILWLFLLMVCYAAAAALAEVNVNGEWEVTVTTSRGERTSIAKFVQDGEKLKVTLQNPRSGESTGEGSIKENEIEWTITRSTPRGEMTITYKGKVDGDTMSGQAQMGERGGMDWKAKKKAS